MNIIILDGEAINPGDLSWDCFKEFGEVTVYNRSNAQEAKERSKDADVILVNKVIINQDFIDSAPQLKFIAETATGYNNVDCAYARSKNIPVCNVPYYGTESVAQMVFAHILNFACKLSLHIESVKKGDWQKSANFCYALEPLYEINGKTLGIIGLSTIGKRVAEIAKVFGMNLIAYHYKDINTDIELLPLKEVFKQADYISLHIPQNSETEKIINKDLISLMKPDAFLINTARGGLIDEADLAQALNNNQIAGAGLDVLAKEPPTDDNPLLTAKNCYISPHNCWSTQGARQRLIEISYENLKAWVDGKELRNQVN